jgi:lipid-binding SYLF domain-containing protein
MMKKQSIAAAFSMALLFAAYQPAVAQKKGKASASKIKANAEAALKHLYSTNERAKEFGKKAKGILVFPEIVKGGFVVGGSFGNGAFFKDGNVTGYYNTSSASWGLQAGVQKYGYALFLMDDAAVNAMNASSGWNVGSSPNLTVVDKGVAGTLSVKTIDKGTFAFFFDQKGLMGGLGLEGSKITKINPGK